MTCLGDNLRRRRLFVGYSITGLAMESDVPVDVIVAIEAGRITMPDATVLARLAQVLHTDSADLAAAPAEELRRRFSVIRGGRGAQADSNPEVA